jgi:hypothetical protein
MFNIALWLTKFDQFLSLLIYMIKINTNKCNYLILIVKVHPNVAYFENFV